MNHRDNGVVSREDTERYIKSWKRFGRYAGSPIKIRYSHNLIVLTKDKNVGDIFVVSYRKKPLSIDGVVENVGGSNGKRDDLRNNLLYIGFKEDKNREVVIDFLRKHDCFRLYDDGKTYCSELLLREAGLNPARTYNVDVTQMPPNLDDYVLGLNMSHAQIIRKK